MGDAGALQGFVEDSLRLGEEGPGRDVAWLQALRGGALSRFRSLGFPTRKDEAWRYTSVAPIANTSFASDFEEDGVDARDLERAAFRGFEGTQLVFVNGRHEPGLSGRQSLPASVEARSLAEVLDGEPDALEGHLGRFAGTEGDAFTALNTACLSDGAYLRIPPDTVVEQPIHLVFVSTRNGAPTASHPRSLLVLERGAEATVVETYAGRGEGTYFTNAVTEAVVGEDAKLDHYKLQRESERAFHVGTLQVHQARSSAVSDTSIALGGLLVRNNVNTWFGGEGGDVRLNGLYVVGGRQHVDNHTRIDHATPHCTSLELYKGILDGEARGVFYGNVVVHKDAQKTSADQKNKNLLLSERALVDSIPGLQINANDVKAKHGSSIGHLEEDAVFYLRSRGLDEPTARSLLTYAFAQEVMNLVRVLPLRAALGMWILSRLPSSDLVREAL